MKSRILIVLLLLVITSVGECQIIDTAPVSMENYRAVLGGSQKVYIDTITPLIQLIKKLEKPWKFVETYKGYWIGYTDDMYSIAHYKNEAILPLTNFIDTSKNEHAKLGALYTLHLIGINSTIVGRFAEDFSNKNARIALLKHLNDDSFHETVLLLLMRDPWLSDIPKFMEYLSEPHKEYSKLLYALRKYNFDNKPLEQKITDSLLYKNVEVTKIESRSISPILELIALQKGLKPHFFVDDEITQSDGWKSKLIELSNNKTYKDSVRAGRLFLNVINELLTVAFNDLNGSYFYTFHDHNVTVYGPIEARQIWLAWWNKLSDHEKNKFYSFVHLPIEERFKRN